MMTYTCRRVHCWSARSRLTQSILLPIKVQLLKMLSDRHALIRAHMFTESVSVVTAAHLGLFVVFLQFEAEKLCLGRLLQRGNLLTEFERIVVFPAGMICARKE